MLLCQIELIRNSDLVVIIIIIIISTLFSELKVFLDLCVLFLCAVGVAF